MAARRHRSENEQEVKIKLSKGDLEKVFNALTRKYEPEEIEHKYLPREYWDTPKLELEANHISARTQYREGEDGALGGPEQTVKLDLPHGNTLAKGAVLRREVKNTVPVREPDLSIVTDARLKAALKPFLRKRLRHIFTASIERRYFEVEVGHGRHRGTVEIAFDAGDITLAHNHRRYPLYEIELEIKSGSKDALDKVRELIMEIAPSAKIQPLSKSQQGSRFYRRSMSASHRRRKISATPPKAPLSP